MRFGSKVPGTSMEIRDVTMDFAYGESFTESSPEAYERLILDVLLGDANLFPRHQEVEQSWKILDPIEEYWDTHGKPAQYAVGHLGPGGGGRDARTRRTELAPAMKIDLTDTTASKINKALVQGRRAIGTPAVGMVLTLVIVTDEENAYDALKAAERGLARAPLAHPRRHQAVTPAPRATAPSPASTPRCGSARTPAPARRSSCGLYGEVSDHAESVVLPLLLPDAPVVVWWPVDAPREPGQGPAGRAGPAPDHRHCTPPSTRCATLDGPRRVLRPGRHRPGLDPASRRGARCWPPPSTRPVRGHLGGRRGRGGQPELPSCWPAGWRPGWTCRSSGSSPPGPVVTAVRLGTDERRDRPRPPRRPARHALHAGPARPRRSR